MVLKLKCRRHQPPPPPRSGARVLFAGGQRRDGSASRQLVRFAVLLEREDKLALPTVQQLRVGRYDIAACAVRDRVLVGFRLLFYLFDCCVLNFFFDYCFILCVEFNFFFDCCFIFFDCCLLNFFSKLC